MANAIEATFAETHQRSLALHERALQRIPSGVTHDNRFQRPFPVYVESASGPWKTDVDGNRYVDYVMGHGALLLGHAWPGVTEAVAAQAARGSHYGASHELEVEWAELVTQLVPSAEMVRFTSSGTEATLMAMRLARAYSGKPAVLKMKGHFHGWHDYAAPGAFRSELPPLGVPDAVLDTVVLSEPAIEDVLVALDTRPDVGAIIVEAAGALTATLPVPPGFLKAVEAACSERGLVFILDEVVTGFRWSPGGVQEVAGVRPHLTTLAKILGGGYPGGAVCGSREVMDILAFPDAPGDWRKTKMGHPGTFNANPVSATAGVACLREVADGTHQQKADRLCTELRAALNQVLREEGVSGVVYGQSSRFRVIFDNPDAQPPRGDCSPYDLPPSVLEAGGAARSTHLLNLALLNRGVFLFGDGGFTSSVHDADTLAHTVEAFRAAVREVSQTGEKA